MKWDVLLTTKANKKKNKLNEGIQAALMLLVEDLKHNGGNPRNNWPNYGKLKGVKGQKKSDDWRHCHLQKGNPTYVCC